MYSSRTLRLLERGLELEQRIQGHALRLQHIGEQIRQLEEELLTLEARLGELKEVEERLWWAHLFGEE